MWLSLLGMAFKTGAEVYKNKKESEALESQAKKLYYEKMAKGEIEYTGKILDSQKNDWKDEFVLIIISLPIAVLAWAVISDDPEALEKIKLFFEYFSQLPSWFTNLWILVVASIYGIKGTQIFRGNDKK